MTPRTWSIPTTTFAEQPKPATVAKPATPVPAQQQSRHLAPPSSPFVTTGTSENLADLLELSRKTPVIVHFWSPAARSSHDLAARLEKLIDTYQGQFLLAHIDASEHPDIAEAFEATTIPAVAALIDGNRLNLFRGAVSDTYITIMLKRTLREAEYRGVTATITAAPL